MVKKSRGQNGAIGGLNRDAGTMRAFAMLARMMLFTRWLETQQPTQDQKRLWPLIVRSALALAELTLDEERAVTAALEMDAAIAATETNNVAREIKSEDRQADDLQRRTGGSDLHRTGQRALGTLCL
jgi:hypothetical protein